MREFINLAMRTYQEQWVFCQYKDIFIWVHPPHQDDATLSDIGDLSLPALPKREK
jgi:hypothetical protein